eukprot:gene6313-6173_t
MQNSTPSVVILISGRGSNLNALIDHAKQTGAYQIRAVISNRPTAAGLALAQSAGLDTAILDHTEYDSREAFDAALAGLIDQYQPNWVVLAGFMRVLTEGFVNRYVGQRQGAQSRYGLVSTVAQLIDLLAQFEGPADAAISRFFKDHPELGGRDRPMVAEAVYCWLRYRYRINHLAQSGEGPSVVRQAKLALLWSGAPEQIWSAGKQADNEWLSRVINISADDLGVEARTCLPEWFYTKLAEQFGQARAESFSQAVLSAAPLDLRVNTVKASTTDLLAALTNMGIQVNPIEGLPEGLRAVGKPIVGKTEVFQEGYFEVQDAGSQWVSRLVAPRRGDLVIDFCAGAGGKTLAIGAQMKNTGRIVALDTSEKRLVKFKPRAARSGLSNFYTMVINDEADPRLNKYFGKADRVVTD